MGAEVLIALLARHAFFVGLLLGPLQAKGGGEELETVVRILGLREACPKIRVFQHFQIEFLLFPRQGLKTGALNKCQFGVLVDQFFRCHHDLLD